MTSFTDEVVKELGKCVIAEFIKKSSRTEKTTAVRKALQRVCKRRSVAGGLLRYFGTVKGQTKEFLVDGLCWEEGQGVVAAIESEWGTGWRCILEDFEKLLVLKSVLKVMVFQTTGKSMVARREADAIRVKLLEYMYDKYAHHVAGEKYVFVEFYGRDERGDYGFAAHEYTVPENGKLKQVPFAMLMPLASAATA